MSIATPPRPYAHRNASPEAVLKACQRAAQSPCLEGVKPTWVRNNIVDGKGGLKGRRDALWVLHLRELEYARGEAQESWGAAYLPQIHQEALGATLGDKPSFKARKGLEDALWALYRLEHDAEDSEASHQPRGKQGSSKPHLEVVAS